MPQPHFRGTDRHAQSRGRRCAEPPVNILQTGAKEGVKDQVAVGLKIGSVPPKPVAPLGRIEIFPSGLLGFLGEVVTTFRLFEEVAGAPDPVPGPVLLWVPDPDVEISPNPGTGVNSANRRSFLSVEISSQGLRPDPLGGSEAVIKLV